jgi:hypothetical protein
MFKKDDYNLLYESLEQCPVKYHPRKLSFSVFDYQHKTLEEMWDDYSAFHQTMTVGEIQQRYLLYEADPQGEN